MLDPKSWLHLAEQLPEGNHKRVDHDCGPGRAMTVWNKGDGYSAWCHRCSEAGFVAKQVNMEQRLARLQQKAEAQRSIQATVAPPMPATFDPDDWPLACQVWLYKAGLTKDVIRQRGFYYHEPSDRVILPVLNESGQVVFWQGRSLDPTAVKYINPLDTDRSRLVYRAGSGNKIVLTEDILSAVRVGQVTEAWSIMGTNLPPLILNDLLALGKPVLVMLDPDAAGRHASQVIHDKLSLLGVDSRQVHAPKDPKLLSREDIEWLIA